MVDLSLYIDCNCFIRNCLCFVSASLNVNVVYFGFILMLQFQRVDEKVLVAATVSTKNEP